MIWSQCCCSSPARPVEAAEFALVQSGDECLSGQFRLSLITHSFCFSVKCLISILYNRKVRTLRSFQHILHASWASAASDVPAQQTTVKTTSSPPERKVLTFNGFYPFFSPLGAEPCLLGCLNQTWSAIRLTIYWALAWWPGGGEAAFQCVLIILILCDAVWCLLFILLSRDLVWPPCRVSVVEGLTGRLVL